ncbi:cyclin-dependent kinase-like 5 [Pseudanabaena phage Pan1]|nr:cyclin-dependent kinase-like 5 [Pseudanabaena phage Pan1]
MLERLFEETVERDFFRLICGEKLGEGAHRQVFECSLDPRLVVKFETEAGSFSNVIEWNVWKDAEFLPDDIKGWLAPCHSISANGAVLLQYRTTPARKYPDRIPAWMTDTKRGNFGMFRGRFVAHDYASNLICNGGLTRRMKKADWW